MVRVVLALLIAAAAVAQEVPLTSPVYDRVHAQFPQIAGDGENFLVAWRDDRMSGGIRATRVTRDAQMLDLPTGIALPRVHTTTLPNRPPAVVWSGAVYVVAWEDSGEIHSVRIDRDGRVLDESPRVIATGRTVSGASTGQRALLVFETAEGVEGVLLDTSGEIVRTIGFPRGGTPRVAAAAGSFLVIWTETLDVERRLFAASVSSDGEAGATRDVGPFHTSLLFAANGDSFLVLYTDVRGQPLLARRLDATGAEISSTRLSIFAHDAAWGTLAPHGAGYLFAANTPRALWAKAYELDADGRPLGDHVSMSLLIREGRVAMATSGGMTMLAREDFAIYARPLDDGRPETLLSRAARDERRPRLTPDGAGYRIAFEAPVLHLARLGADGASLDGEGIPTPNNYSSYEVVFDGRNYVLAGRAFFADGLFVTRLTPEEGRPLDGTNGFRVTRSVFSYGIGTNGRETLVAWTDVADPGWIHATRFSQDGVQTAAMLRIPATTSQVRSLKVAWSDGVWLIVWQELELSGGQFVSGNLAATRVADGWYVLDPTPAILAQRPSSQQMNPVVAARESGFAVAWTLDNTIHAREIAVDGAAGEIVEVASFAVENPEAPSMIWSGGDYVIAWADSGDLFYATLRERVRRPLVASPDIERQVSLAPARKGFVAAYERVATDPQYGGASRIFLRFVAPRARAVRH